jgi:diguanylate cyclase (GGDEF)-like protein
MASSDHARQGGQLLRVLLIDHDVAERGRVEIALTGAHGGGPETAVFEVEALGTLGGGLGRLAQGGIDAVLVELTLPDSAGVETVIQLREAFPDLAIVVLTSVEDEHLALRAIAAGAQDYLIKSRINALVILRVLLYARERHRRQSELRQLAMVDALTGLHNRRGFLTFAEQLIRLARRTARPLVLLFIDLDHLKRVNDSLGHDAGDQTLLEVAALLRATFRATDVVGRIGGDEFVVLAIDAPPNTVAFLTNRLRDRIAQRNADPSHPFALSVSMGSDSLAVGSTKTIEEMIAAADRAMYEQKRDKTATATPTGTSSIDP